MVRVAGLLAALFSASVLAGVILGAGDSSITNAAKSDDLAAVRKLIASHADLNATSGDGSTPLLWAAHNSDLEMAGLLLKAGAKPDLPNHYGITPLLEASRTGDAEMAELFLKAGADPKRTHPEGETTLMASARAGSVPAVRLFLEHGVDVNAADSYQHETALMWAAAEDHLDVVDTLLKAGADPNLQAHVNSLTERKNADHPTGGFTALMWAARNGYEDVVGRLVQAGADLNLKNGDGASAAMIAIYNDRFDLAKELWDFGADVNDGSLYTAVEMRDSTTDQFAFDGSRLRPNHPNTLTALDLVKLLLERGADPYKPFAGQFHSTSMPNTDRFDNSPFLRAAVESDVETLKVMIAHGIDIDRIIPVPPAPPKDAPPADAAAAGGRGQRGNPNAGKTPAMVTMTGGRGPAMTGGPGYIRSGTVPYREPGSRKPEEAFALLVKAGANPNAKGPDGTPMLQMAAQVGNLDMIHALANAGVDFKATNKDGLTALDVVEGKKPAAKDAGERGTAPPAAGAARGRGGRGAASSQDVAKLLRQLMGLPPAAAAPAAGEAQ
ncbi:MAG TPA: ankyrin repeat domain-containing protein [Terriglobia bacterium]|jgi:ankyrin repeat protein